MYDAVLSCSSRGHVTNALGYYIIHRGPRLEIDRASAAGRLIVGTSTNMKKSFHYLARDGSQASNQLREL